MYNTPAPYKPVVKHALDTQNFENFEEGHGTLIGGSPSQSGMKRWTRADPTFVGYTYKNWEAVHPAANDGELLHLCLCVVQQCLSHPCLPPTCRQRGGADQKESLVPAQCWPAAVYF